jgi:hypothetical protein
LFELHALSRWNRTDAGVGSVGDVVVVLAVAWSTVLWVSVGVVMFLVLWFAGTAMLRSMTTPLPPPPPEGELRKVNVRYRCSVCGVELRMLLAPEEDPPPPRHCQEDMDLVAPIE